MVEDDHAVRRLGFPVIELTIGRVVAEQARVHRGRTFLHFLPDGRRFSYEDMDRLSNRLANGLLRAGVEPGAHVAVMMENSPEQLLLFFALGKLGAVAVPINVAARGQLLQYYLAHSDCVAFVGDTGLMPHLHEIRDTVPAVTHLFAFAAQGRTEEPPAKGVLEVAALFDAPETAPDIAVAFSDLAFLLFTSGTTGPSKAIMFTHAYALLYGIDQAENYGFRQSDIVHVCLPYFHANGLLSNTYGPLAIGAQVALSRRFSASNFWHEVRSSGATALSLLGSMANILWSLPARPEDSDNQVRQATVVPVPTDALGFQERFGLRIISTYGLTDYGLGCIFTLADPPSKLGSAGRVRRGMRLRIVDENDQPLPPGEAGEIVMRSAYAWNTSPGYYKMPAETLASRRNLWFHTGDRGYFDPDGYLFFADRKKDAIRRRGENISAFEVEQAIASHPSIEDVAVFAVASPLGEDEVACAIVLAPGASLAEADLVAHCRKNLSYFMVPRYVRFVEDLPRSQTHKVEKYKLRQDAEGNRERYWDRDKATPA